MNSRSYLGHSRCKEAANKQKLDFGPLHRPAAASIASQGQKHSCSRQQVRQGQNCSCGRDGQGGAWSRRKQLVSALLVAVPLQTPQSLALDKELAKTRAEYDQSAGSYDQLNGGAAANLAGFPKLRRELLGKASGAVLEVAVGTGLNLPLYDPSRMKSYTGVDLSPGMLAQARNRLGGLQRLQSVTLQEGNVDSLPFADASFDSVVSTFSLCVFDHPAKALQEMARVLKSDGQMLLLEHSRSSFAPLAWYQDVSARAVAASSKGCVWNQDLGKLLASADLRTVRSRAILGGLVTLVEARVT